jgi:septum formation topological specificity factor MinE
MRGYKTDLKEEILPVIKRYHKIKGYLNIYIYIYIYIRIFEYITYVYIYIYIYIYI